MKAVFTKIDNESNWVGGIIEGTNAMFQAKVFEEGSKHGINNGRVSKLWIMLNGTCICNYDRGWDLEPIGAYRKYYNCIMELLEG